MNPPAPSFTLGVEEEYLLVDRETRDLVETPPEGLLQDLQERLGERVSPEFLRSQIEVGTGVCQGVREARWELARLRRTVAEAAERYGLAPIAASSHPFAHWTSQKPTEQKRYELLAEEMQSVVRRLLTCATHVHVGVEGDELRIDLMQQASYFLPHLLALSTSSPFWVGKDTGLKSYRVAVMDQLPRTGLPERFESWTDYRRHLETLTGAGLIEDDSMIWWDIRPSPHFPTLEMRITDVCTRLEDTVCIAALYASIIRMLYRLKLQNQRWRIYTNMLIRENRWRAQRYGFDAGLIDFGRGEIVPCSDLLEELIEIVRPDAYEAGCLPEVLHAREILRRGTSAHRQLDLYHREVEEGTEPEEALRKVVDMLVQETVQGI